MNHLKSQSSLEFCTTKCSTQTQSLTNSILKPSTFYHTKHCLQTQTSLVCPISFHSILRPTTSTLLSVNTIWMSCTYIQIYVIWVIRNKCKTSCEPNLSKSVYTHTHTHTLMPTNHTWCPLIENILYNILVHLATGKPFCINFASFVLHINFSAIVNVTGKSC